MSKNRFLYYDQDHSDETKDEEESGAKCSPLTDWFCYCVNCGMRTRINLDEEMKFDGKPAICMHCGSNPYKLEND